jgi:HAD superfamily hydrolase (TIGR01549 family)
LTPIDGDAIDAILLDIDGTIVDTDDAAVERASRWFRLLPSVLAGGDPQRAARRFVMAAETPVNALVAWLDRTHLDQVVGPVMNGLSRLRGVSGRSHAQLIPGIEATLHRLAGRYPLGIVTAREHASAHAILETYALSALFQCVATARTCRRAKPHPAPVAWSVDQLGVDPACCLMVGDTTADILSGTAAGTLTVGVLCGFGDQQELMDAGADMILPSTAALADLLLGSESTP